MSGIRARFAGRLGSFDFDVGFTAPERGVTALFGPSGCGKTTALRCLAGLERLDGELVLGDEVWQDRRRFVPPHRRAVGYVFQEASLFPHLSVTGNLAFGRRRAVDRGVEMDEVVALLGLGGLLDRAPARLSGGERQRVAIGRALLSQPRLLLMDEPLSALDGEGKAEILGYLERLHDVLAIPVIYVTHDMAEVERLADNLVLLERGRVTGAGDLHAMLASGDYPLSRRTGAAAVIEGRVVAVDAAYDLARVAVAGAEIVMPLAGGVVGAHRRLRIKADDVSICRVAPASTSILNVLPAEIVEIVADEGHQATLVLALGEAGGGARLLSRISRKSRDALALARGDAVFAQVKGVALA